MEPIRTENTNKVYRGGQPDVADLPTQVAVVDIGSADRPNPRPVVYSVWMPTDLERRRIANGENVRVGILGTALPPLIVEAVDEGPYEPPVFGETDEEGGRR